MPQLGSSGDKLNGLQKAMAINEGDSEQWQQQARVKEHETISGKQQDTRAGQDLAGKRTETGNCDASQNGRTSKLNCAIVRRTISKLNPKRCCQKTRNSLHGSKSKSVSPFDDLNYAENQNSITTLNLFKYASLSERFAVALGIMCMFYAASWQPISVFILAIMASLMGQYSKQTSFILQLNNQTGAARAGAPEQPLVGQALGGSGPFEGETSGKVRAPAVQSDYENFPLLKPLYSIVDPIFEFAMRAQTTSDRLDSRSAFQANFSTNSIDDEQIIRADVDDILQHESSIFLKKSFEINGSAFLLALTQLLAFFCGLTIITWAARKQASRLKILYFTSCLHQEVTWFEAVDSAGGSGSSLNALVDRYEDGIGMKLALLCYFVGHICLFALTAFYQMFELAAFCMPFVLIVGLIIAYLSDLQADSIGDHALFAKRSLQLAEEIIAAIRTVFAFNGQQKEITRYSVSLKPVYRKSLIKHLYTALNTSLSKFSIFACFSAYCFYAMRLFPPYDKQGPANKATVLAVMRGAEVSIVNILISIPFMEALQQSKGSIARIYAAIERRSKIDPSSGRGLRPASRNWLPSISFRQVSFSYTERHGPTNRRRSTLPFLNLPGSPGSGQQPLPLDSAEFGADDSSGQASGDYAAKQRRRSLIEGLTGDFEVELPSRRNSKASTMAGSGSTATIEINNEHIQRRLSSNQVINKSFNRQADVDKINRKILNRFNLEIKAGQSVALVGPSGSGKSTVLALVQRLYDITGGQILIGNHDLKNLNISWLRNQIGVVTQEARLFDMSIAENIKLGLCSQQLNSDESGDSCSSISSSSDSSDELNDFKIMQQVIGAAKEANAHDFISKLPSGYQTKVGSGGVQLSGGQKQRIAIARALIRKPKILLLDECTSALDTESEALVKNSLMMASKNRTTLTVAHRLDTIKHCDMIVVMSEGQVVECGTHEQLMRVQEVSASGAGTYKSMYEEQLESIASNESTLGEPRGKGAQFGLAEQASDEIGTCKGDRSGLDNVKFVQSTNDDDCLSRGASKWTEEAAGNRSSQLPEVRTVDEEADEDVDDFSSDISINPANIERPSAWQLWQFISMPKWSATAAAIVCLLSGLILPINLIAHSYLFSAFAYNDSEQLGDYLHVFGLIILSFSSLVFIISFLQIILPGYVGEKLSIRLRIKMLDSLLNKPMFYFDMDSNSAGALCDRFNSYIAHLQNIAGTRTATILESSSTLLAGAIFGFGQSLQLSLFCLSFALLVLLTTIVESKIVQRESSVLQKYDARLAHMIADALSNIKTIASLNKEQVFIARFRDIIRQREQGTGTRLVLVKTFLISVKFVMPAMSWSASMYYGCHLLVDGRIDLQTVFIVCPVVLFAVNDTFRALVFLPELLKARKSIKRLYRMNHEFSPKVLQTLTLGQQLEQQNALHAASMAAAMGDKFEAQPATRSKLNLNHSNSNDQNTAASTKRKSMVNFAPETTTLEYDLNGAPMEGPQLVNRRISMAGNLPSYMGRKASRLNSLVPRSMARGRIDFKGVEFAYPNRPTALVLQDFSLSIEPGQSVALVGGSGSGKSTCVQIIEKFYDYHAGDILLDGRDLRLVESNWVRSQIGLVSQEPCLLSYTIGDNIRYGDNSRFVSMEEVVQAARTANIHDFIMSLPDQYDTQLSSSSYSCSQLSGGQRQRIAIARALIGNAPILVFDEATSALDSRNETVVQDALNKARRGRTNLTIAHRLATVRDADKIAVMKEGRVVELGRHEQLLQIENGQYRKLWEQQEGGGSRRAADLPAPL